MEGVLLVVGTTLLVALVLSEVAERAGEPALLGEIAAGVLLGPSGVGLLDYEGTFAVLATLGAMLLFFDVGYEQLDLDELLETGPAAVSIALFGMLVPATAGVALGFAFGYGPVQTAFLGLALSVTSIAVTARTLLHMGQLDTPIGTRVVGAAVVDDVVGLLWFALLLIAATGGGPVEGLVSFGKMLAFFAFAVLVRRGAVGRLSSVLARSAQVEADLVAILGLTFLAGYGAEATGLDVTVGALVAGLLVGEDERFSQLDVREGIVGVAYGLFIPLFFAGVGARLDLSVLAELDAFVVALVVVGLATKFVGGAVGDLVAGGSPRQAVAVGVGMLPKTGVELAIVGAALAEGLVTARVFSAVVLLVLVSVLVTPSLLQAAVRRAGGTATESPSGDRTTSAERGPR
jgi:Kef-type K+ transport system membrane component KefB